jgi:hypothetical protein
MIARDHAFRGRRSATPHRSAHTLAYAAAQRGLNLLDGDPDLDDGALLELGKSQIADEELVIMTELRTRELERRISQR